jgi:hypothetical protein
MALMIAQARADEMLDRNGTPEPFRAILKNQMTDITSNLRMDSPAGIVKRWWSERGCQDQGRRFLTATHMIIFAGDRVDVRQLLIVRPDGQVDIGENDGVKVVGARVCDYDENYRRDCCVAIEGKWVRTSEDARIPSSSMVWRAQTDEKFIVTGSTWEYTTRNPGVENLESFPAQTEWHVIVSQPQE